MKKSKKINKLNFILIDKYEDIPIQSINNNLTLQQLILKKNLKDISAQFAFSNSSIELPIAIDHDKISNTLIPIKISTKIPETFYMQFPITQLLFNKQNKLATAELFLFSFLCDNFAHYAEFSINSSFWDTIASVMRNCNISYTQNSIARSLNKLVKASIVIRIAKGCYAINKILVYSGNLQNRHSDITNQFLKKACKDANTNTF